MATTIENTITHKRGDGFALMLQLPESFADGQFSGWTLQSQVRTATDALVADLICAWADPLTTRIITLTLAETPAWPVGWLYCDVQLSKAGEPTISTDTVTIYCVKDITRV